MKYDHFEVEVGADGFPVELGAGAMAITYRARDTVLNSVVALKVIDRRVAQNPGARSRFLRVVPARIWDPTPTSSPKNGRRAAGRPRAFPLCFWITADPAR